MTKKRKYRVAAMSIFFVLSLIFGRYHGTVYVHADEDSGSSASLVIDNRNVYSGMKTSYSKGYVPTVNAKNAVLVLPLLSDNEFAGDMVRASLRLGESENFPFVCKNYEKSVKLAYHKTNKKSVKCYLINFRLELKNKRYNGTYPVTVTVRGNDKNGNEVCQDFTVYVTIANGIDASAQPRDDAAERKPELPPKVMIRSCEFSKNKLMCGEEFTANITLYNTSRKVSARNMMVTVQPGENVELLSKTDSSYVRTLGAGKSCKLPFVFRVASEAPKGQYSIAVNLDYADESGNTYTAQEAVWIPASQETKLEIAPVNFPKSIQLGESAEVQTQLMNLGKGKIYQVRAVLEADGLTPSAQLFIGDMEGGTEMSDGIEITAEGLSGDSLYGKSQGKITFYYEDEMGNEMTQSQDFETAILSPLSEDTEREEVDDTRQWWLIMALILIILFNAAVILIARKLKQAHMEEVRADGM